MEGAALRSEREYDLTIAAAWHAAKFDVLASNNKLKALSNYIGKKSEGKRSPSAEANAFFRHLKASGFPVEITRTPRKDPVHGR